MENRHLPCTNILPPTVLHWRGERRNIRKNCISMVEPVLGHIWMIRRNQAEVPISLQDNAESRQCGMQGGRVFVGIVSPSLFECVNSPDLKRIGVDRDITEKIRARTFSFISPSFHASRSVRCLTNVYALITSSTWRVIWSSSDI